MKKRLWCVALIIVIVPLFAHDLQAGAGRVISTDAKVVEEGEKAVILHNGEEEILILSADLKSDKKAGMLRFIPFPSEPQASLAPEKAFDAAGSLIKARGLKSVVTDRGGVPFLVNAVELEGPARSTEPVMYRFKSKELYYPLAVLNTFGGQGRIDLVVICPRTIGTVYEQPFKGFPYAEATTSRSVIPDDLAGICPDPKAFFKGQDRLYIQMISYFGTYTFDADFTADIARGADREVNYEEIFPADAAMKKELAATPELPRAKTAAELQAYEQFTCHKNFFKAEVPKGWRQEEDISGSEVTNEYGVTLLGPKSPEGPVPLISLLYFGPDHAMFKSAQAFIERNKAVDPDSGEKVSDVSEITVAGRKAYSFDKERLDRMPSAGEPEEFVTVERVIVVSAKEGFYVLEYMAPESVEGNYLSIFEKTVESFKPNK